MTKSQDTKILTSLINTDESTAYAISQDTGISIPQVNYRLNKLIESKAVTSLTKGEKTYYYVHPALKSDAVIKNITALMKQVADEIDTVAYTEPSGMRVIIEFIISKLDISEPPEEDIIEKDISLSEDIMISDFKKRLELYAKEHGLKITNIKGWTESKIAWIALNDNKCGCAPDKRKCPCPEGLEEVKRKGKCLCSVFERGG